MGRKITKTIPLAQVYYSEDVYPRTQPSWQTAYIYSQNMLSGSKFPPIVLALYKGKNYLVDGKHRFDAHRILKKKVIKAEIYTGWDKRKIYEEAVRRNVAHGQVLSPYEKRKIILKLRTMKYSNRDISKLVHVPLDKLHHFVGQRLVSSTTGETIVDTIVKSALKHKAGGQYSQHEVETMENMQGQISSKSQVYLLNQVEELLRNNLIDWDNKLVYESLMLIKKHLQNVK